MQYFRDCAELLSLFEIDPNKPGAEDFIALSDVYGLMSRFPQYSVTVADLAALLMRQRRLSPRVFWSRMKRAVRPLIEAEAETLRALGVPCGFVSGDHVRTCPELAAEIGAATGVQLELNAEQIELAASVAEAVGHAK